MYAGMGKSKMGEMTVLTEIHHHHIGAITLNRPDVYNALNDAVINAIHQSIVQFRDAPNIRAILIHAKGKHFCSGADLNWMKQSVNLSLDENREDARTLANLFETLFHCPKPVILAAQGNAYGGALGLLACADIVLATPQSRFCFSEVKLGLVPAVISPYVVHAIGQRQANRFFLAAEPFDGEQAQQIGLVHHIVQSDELTARALAVCDALMQHGPEATQACKTLIRTVAPLDAATQAYTVDLIARLRTSREGQEGLAAFLEKRRPHWAPQKH